MNRIAAVLLLLLAPLALAQEAWQSDLSRARRLAQQSDDAGALEALAAAYQKGLRDIQSVLVDPALQRLHGEQQFRSFVRSYSKAEPLLITMDDEPGEPMIVRGQIYGPDGKPGAGALVYAYQADDEGKYTERDPMDEPHARIFGYVRSNDQGKIELHTVRPGAYPERTDAEGAARYIPRHLHLDVTTWGGATAKVQLVFEDDPRLSHPYWQEWVRRGGHPVARLQRMADGTVVAMFELRMKG